MASCDANSRASDHCRVRGQPWRSSRVASRVKNVKNAKPATGKSPFHAESFFRTTPRTWELSGDTRKDGDQHRSGMRRLMRK